MKKAIIIFLSLIVITVIILFTKTETLNTQNIHTVDFETETISFVIPQGYFLEEKELGNGERRHLSITLTEDTEENKLIREGKAPGREGPVAITLDIFQNLELVNAETWIKTNNSSNWKLGESPISPVSVGENTGYEYEWDGLYRARSVVFIKDSIVIMTTVTYMDKTEPITEIFNTLISTLSFNSQ